MKPRDRRYESLIAVSVAAGLCFVLVLELFGESEHKSLAILVALFFWLIATLVMVLNVPRYLIRLFRDHFGLIGESKKDKPDKRSDSK